MPADPVAGCRRELSLGSPLRPVLPPSGQTRPVKSTHPRRGPPNAVGRRSVVLRPRRPQVRPSSGPPPSPEPQAAPQRPGSGALPRGLTTGATVRTRRRRCCAAKQPQALNEGLRLSCGRTARSAALNAPDCVRAMSVHGEICDATGKLQNG